MSGRGQTPARTTRATTRATTPLPALQTRQSHAYGAAGKAALHSQVTTSHDALDEAFTATARDSREPTPAVRRTTRSKKTQSIIEEPSQPESESEEVISAEPTQDFDDQRPSTSLQDSALYAQRSPPRFPMAAPPPPRRNPLPTYPTAPATGPRQNRQPRQSQPPYEPPRWRIFLRTIPKYIPFALNFFFVYMFMAIGMIAVFSIWYAKLPLSDPAATRRSEVWRGTMITLGFPGYEQPPNWVERQWHMYRHVQIWNETLPYFELGIDENLQALINVNLLSRMNFTTEALKNLTSEVRVLESQVNSQDQAIQSIQRLLPQGLALVQQNGEWVIPSVFWNALLQKMSGEEASPLWDKFVAANARHISAMEDDFLAGRVEGVISSLRLLSSDSLQTALEENRRLMERSLDEKMEGMRSHLVHEVRLESAQAIKDHFTGNPVNFARWNVVNNLERRIHERNFLAPGLGALVDPHHTSATFGDLTIMQTIRAYGWWMTGLAAYALPEMLKNPPVVALLPWEEAKQCWCAAHDSDTKAQLGVQLAYKIHPENLMIEHIPPDGTLDIAAAPRKWAMWAQVDNATEATRMKAVLDDRISTFTVNECGEPPKGKSEHWVCVAANDYQIHNNEFVASYAVDYWHGSLHEDVLLTNKIVFKVLENWGAEDHTCLYRIRLTGTPESAFEHISNPVVTTFT